MQDVQSDALGLDDRWLQAAEAAGLAPGQLGRICGERGDRYQVATASGEAGASVSGRLRRAIEEGEAERPAVGDWVGLRPLAEGREGQGDERVVEQVLPRRTTIARRAAGRAIRRQVVAANVDVVLIVCALGRDVNPGRIERFVAIAWGGGARPVLLLNKVDLFDDPSAPLARARRAAAGADVHLVSALTGQGLEAVEPLLAPGSTLVLLGTSGAGKSTLANRLLGQAEASTGELRGDGKGRHTSTHRQMFLLPQGAVLIDTPGLREVGLWSGDEGLSRAFEDVAELAGACRFGDCRHEGEPGCAVEVAVERGEVDAGRVEAWRRLLREQAFVEQRAAGANKQRAKLQARQGTMALRERLREKGRRG
jgi:ribosome biogenesis GTPase / thiamine phosphate phosphatase